MCEIPCSLNHEPASGIRERDKTRGENGIAPLVGVLVLGRDRSTFVL